MADKIARWLQCRDSGWQCCSFCGVAVRKSAVKWVKASEDKNLNYCPHCGARIGYLPDIRKEPRWISVKDRLPEKGVEVLTAVYGTDVIMLQKGESLNDAIRRAFSGPGRVEVGCIDEDGYWVECTFGGPMIIAPKYWMPMPTAPEPPEEVSGDAYER